MALKRGDVQRRIGFCVSGAGVALFLGNMAWSALNFGNFDNLAERSRAMGFLAVLAMGIIIVGSLIVGTAAGGPRAARGAQGDVGEAGQIKVRCRYCGGLSDERAERCEQCGGAL